MGNAISRQVGLHCISQVAEQGRVNKPMKNDSLVGSASAPSSRFLPWPSSVADCNLLAVINPFLLQFLLAMYHSNRKQSRTFTSLVLFYEDRTWGPSSVSSRLLISV